MDGTVAVLSQFNFWIKEVPYKGPRSVQGVLRGKIQASSGSTGCTSDQGGSQESGGGDCNSDGTSDADEG